MSLSLILGLVGIVVVALVVALVLFKKGSEAALPPSQEPGKAKLPEPSPAEPPSARQDAPQAVPPKPPAPAPEPSPAPARSEPPHDSFDEAPTTVVVPLTQRTASAEDLQAMRRGLTATRGGFIGKLAKLFGGGKEIDASLLQEVEEVLLTSDIGTKTTVKLTERLRDKLSRKDLGNADRVWDELREEARAILAVPARPIPLDRGPSVILVVGVNGVGKTTTIGKLASRLTQQGKNVVLAAGDTFRAAAVLQLEVWGRRTGCTVIKGKEGADPGSVIFDAIRRAKDEGADIVIADTAGRLHTKAPLMDELRKVGRTVEKALERPADEILLVLDATNGQNALSQAALFREALPVSGIVLTKLDGTAKGGVVLGIVDEHRLPVRFIGLGEKVEDLREFDTEAFVEALFERPEAPAA